MEMDPREAKRERERERGISLVIFDRTKGDDLDFATFGLCATVLRSYSLSLEKKMCEMSYPATIQLGSRRVKLDQLCQRLAKV